MPNFHSFPLTLMPVLQASNNNCLLHDVTLLSEQKAMHVDVVADATLLYFYFRFGRKPVLFGANAMLSIFSCAVAFAPSWPVFTALFFLMGMGQISSYITVFVLGMDFTFSPFFFCLFFHSRVVDLR